MTDKNHLYKYGSLPLCVFNQECGFAYPEIAGERRTLFPEHIHRAIEVTYVDLGRRIVSICGHEYEIHAGDMYIVNPFDLHTGWALRGEDRFHNYAAVFELGHFAEMVPSDGGQFLCGVGRGAERFVPVVRNPPAEVVDTMKSLDAAYKDDSPMRMLSYVYKILDFLVRECACKASVPVNPNFSFIAQVTDIVDVRYSEELTTSRISEELSYSESYFCRKFRDCFGTTFTEYLNAARMRKAMNLLIHSDMNFQSVASVCGINDYAHFSKLFKRYSGASPGDFCRRKKMR